MAALELSPAAAGLTEAPWPPPSPDKRGVTVDAKESFLDVCAREKCTFPALMKLNFQLDIDSPALKTKWPRIVNFYLRKHLKCTRLTPGGNYKFTGGETIYIPTAPSPGQGPGPRPITGIDPGTGTGPLPPGEKGALSWTPFERTLFKRPFATNAVEGEITLAIKGEFALLEGDTSLKGGLSNGELGLGIARKLSDDITLQVGSKLTLDKLKKDNRGNLLKSLKESTEVTLGGDLFKPTENTKISLEVGAQFSRTPIVIKVAGAGEGKLDIGKYVNTDSLPLAFTGQIELTFALRPSIALLRILGSGAAAAGLILLMPAMVFFGAWDYGRRLENNAKVRLLFNYVFGYEAEIFGSVPGWLGPDTGDQEGNKLAEAGRTEAEKDAKENFSGMSERPQIVYLRALLMAVKEQPGDQLENARNLLRKILWRRLQETVPGGVTPPIRLDATATSASASARPASFGGAARLTQPLRGARPRP